MSNPMNKGTLFDPTLVTELINKVRGKSTLATLSAQVPVSINGNKEFTFTFDSDIDIVAESGAKSHGGMTVAPITMIPIKVEYGARVSDEFMYATEEEQIAVLQGFSEGYAKKIAAGLDKMAFHGINPRTGSASSVIGTNHFDSLVTNTVTYSTTAPDDNIDDAIDKVEDAEMDVTGIAMSPAMRGKIADMKNATTGERLYPEFAFGGKPATLGAQALDINKTVATGGVDEAIVGDFANMFKWGIAKEIPLEVIQYGDPDNSGNDLKGHNQVYLRAETYIAWAIFAPEAFCRVVD